MQLQYFWINFYLPLFGSCCERQLTMRWKFELDDGHKKTKTMSNFDSSDQCFLTGWMVHPRVNEIFARVNERKGVNEISVANFLYPKIPCICLVFFTQNISAIMNKMAKFKLCNFASSAVNNLSLQKNRTLVQLTAFIT